MTVTPDTPRLSRVAGLAVCFILVTTATKHAGATAYDDETALHKSLTENNVNKHVRPAKEHADTVNVTISLTLVQVQDLDEKNQVLSTSMWLSMSWVDPRLAWDPTEHNSIQSTRVPVADIWTPDIAVYNHVGDATPFPMDLLPIVYSHGMVLWVPPVTIRSICLLDMTRFPYDEHVCQIKMGSWTYPMNLVNVTLQSEKLTQEAFADSHLAWDVTNTNVAINHRVYDCCPETYPDITLNLTLSRRRGYLNHVFVGPSVVIAFVVPVIFLLPVESTEKLVLGVGTLIGQVLLLTMLEEFLPSAHPTAPTIALYYLLNIILIAFSLIFSAIVINIWQRRTRKHPVPGIFRMLFLGALGRLMCVNRDTYVPVDPDQNQPRHLDIISGEDGDTNGMSPASDRVQFGLAIQQQTIAAEWRQFAAIIDRLLFVVYVIILLFVTIGLLGGV